MKRGTLVLLSAALIALLSGCGGGGSSNGSNADFVAQGNQICKEDNAKFAAVKVPTSSSSSATKAYLDKLVPLLDDDLNRLRGLKPPSSKQATYDDFISLLQQSNDLTKKQQSGDTSSSLYKASQAISKQADADATKLGLPQCTTAAVRKAES